MSLPLERQSSWTCSCLYSQVLGQGLTSCMVDTYFLNDEKVNEAKNLTYEHSFSWQSFACLRFEAFPTVLVQKLSDTKEEKIPLYWSSGCRQDAPQCLYLLEVRGVHPRKLNPGKVLFLQYWIFFVCDWVGCLNRFLGVLPFFQTYTLT